MRRRSFVYHGPAKQEAARRVVVRSTDTLVLGKYEVSADILREVVTPGKRVLWAFVGDGANLRPVAYSEDRVIWLSDEDLVRKEA